MIEKSGDLFSTDAPIIGHGVNCQGLMGSGIAVQFRKRYPDMYEQYKGLCDNHLLWPGDVFPWVAEDKIIFNLASQFLPGANASEISLYHSVYRALYLVNGSQRIALPRIGAGIGGLDWETEAKPAIIRAELDRNAIDMIEVWTLPS